MPEVRVRENENIESALKRFKKKIQKAVILSEIKRRERYEKPSVKRKRKSEAARKRKVQNIKRGLKKPLFCYNKFMDNNLLIDELKQKINLLKDRFSSIERCL